MVNFAAVSFRFVRFMKKLFLFFLSCFKQKQVCGYYPELWPLFKEVQPVQYRGALLNAQSSGGNLTMKLWRAVWSSRSAAA